MNYKIKNTKKLRKKLVPFCKEFSAIEDEFYTRINELEKRMEENIGIKGIVFFPSDGSYVGVGNADRTMELIHFEEILKE